MRGGGEGREGEGRECIHLLKLQKVDFEMVLEWKLRDNVTKCVSLLCLILRSQSFFSMGERERRRKGERGNERKRELSCVMSQCHSIFPLVLL